MRLSLHRTGGLACAILLLGMTACSTTTVDMSWQDPEFSRVPFRKVLAAFQTDDPGLRRVLEDEMARHIPNAVAGYQVVPDEAVRDLPRAKAIVAGEGFDSVVVMRIVAVERELRYVPGAVHPVPVADFWGSWHRGWVMAYEPGFLRTDRIVHVSTRIYSTAQDRLVWASRTETYNPQTLRAAIAGVVRANAKVAGDALRKGGG